MKIWLTREEIEKCMVFSRNCALNQQRIEFGQKDTAQRSVHEISRDNLIGKLAEAAFAKMLRNTFGIETELDFNYYPRGRWDDQDAVVNGWRIDVKATRRGGHWMLIEWNKLNFRQKQHALSHLYVMAVVDWDKSSNMPLDTVELVGCASVGRLKAGVPGTLILRKGSFIPGTHTALQADNFAIPFERLESDWYKVLRYVVNNPPPNTDLYPNPYTGEVIPDKPVLSENETVAADHQVPEKKLSIVGKLVRKLKRFFGRKAGTDG